MSLRVRLAAVLSLVLLVPALLVVAFVTGVPATLDADRSADATRDAGTVSAALSARCDGIADTAAGVARDVASTGVLFGPAADAVTRRAADRRPGTVVAVLDRAGKAVSTAGITPTQATRAAWFARQSSCALAVPAPAAMPGVLAESSPVVANGIGIGTVVAWVPLDDAVLRDLRSTLGIHEDLVLMSAAARADSPPADAVSSVAATTAPRSRLGAVAEAVLDGAASGSAGGLDYLVRDAEPGMPYTVVVVADHGPPVWRRWTVAGGAAAAVLFSLVAGWLLAGRLTRGVRDLAHAADRLPTVQHELRRQQDAVTGVFDAFGEALGRTHDLERLLQTLASAAVQGADAAAAVIHLSGPAAPADTPAPAGPPAGSPDGKPPTPDGVHERARVVRGDLAGGATAADALAPLAREAAARGVPAAASSLPGSGPAFAVPLRDGERVLGALAVARRPGDPPLDGPATDRVRALTAHAGTAVANVLVHEEARRLSVTDPLTGVGNVRLLSTTLSREVGRAGRFDHPLTVLMLDLDHFKAVNDELGHASGDVVLREVAGRLIACVREVDTVARYGGEEFAVILPETDVDGATRVAERILEAVRSLPFRAGDRERTVTVSIGIAAYPEHGRSAADLLQSADTAMYMAKRGGRNSWRRAGIPEHAVPAARAR